MTLCERLQRVFGDDYIIQPQEKITPNNVKKVGVLILKKNDTCGPIIYYDPQLDDVTNVKYIIQAYIGEQYKVEEIRQREQEVLRIMKSKELFLSHIIPVCVNRFLNRELVENCPYVEFVGDLQVIFLLEGDIYATFVRKEMIKALNISLDELIEHAQKNVRPILVGLGENIGYLDNFDEELSYVLTQYPNGVYGSGTLFAPKTLEYIKNKLHEDSFYLFPFNMHECLVIRPCVYEELGEFLSDFLEEANGQLPEEEHLSNMLFMYENGKIVRVQ